MIRACFNCLSVNVGAHNLSHVGFLFFWRHLIDLYICIADVIDDDDDDDDGATVVYRVL